MHGYPRGKGRRKGQIKNMKLIQTTMQKTDNQQRYNVQHRELQPLFCSNGV